VTRPGISAVAAVFIAGALMNLIVILIGVRSRSLPRARVQPGLSLRLLRSAVPLGLYAIATTFYVGIDMVILQRLAPAANVGWYAAGYRLFTTATILPSIVAGVVLFPVLSRLSLGARADLRAVIEKALTFLTLCGVAVALVFVVFADRIVTMLYPAQGYAPTVTTLRLLAPGLVFIYVNWVFGASLLGLHQERRLLKMAAAAAVLNPVANLLVIPVFQQDGAAVITSLTELGVLLWLTRSMPKDLVPRESLTIAAKAVAAAVAAALVVIVVGDQPLLVTLPVALAVYAAGVLALQAVTAAELRALLTALGGGPEASVLTAESVGGRSVKAAGR
jgi:O-antigen/teichoic acid export membrane protein